MPVDSIAKPQRFEVLDSFRGVAALLVAFMHLQALHHFYFTAFVRHSYLFVDFFFVLSGFVITHAYRFRLNSKDDTVKFVIRRFGRVWPLHMAVLLILILAQFAALVAQASGIAMPKPPFTENWDVSAIPSNVFLVQALGVNEQGTWNFPSWSISAEFWAYLTFAAAVFILRKHLVLVSAFIVFCGLAVIYAFSPDYMDATYDYGYFRCIAGFFTGVIVQVVRRPIALKKGPATALELSLLASASVFVALAGGTVASLAAPLLFAFVVYVFASEQGAVSTALRTKPFLALGRWSYSIYMVHAIYYLVLFRNGPRVLERFTGQPLMKKIIYEGETRDVLDAGGALATDAVAAIYLALVVLTAWITYRLVEDPSRRWFNALSDKLVRKAVAPAEQTSSSPAL